MIDLSSCQSRSLARLHMGSGAHVFLFGESWQNEVKLISVKLIRAVHPLDKGEPAETMILR